MTDDRFRYIGNLLENVQRSETPMGRDLTASLSPSISSRERDFKMLKGQSVPIEFELEF